MKTTELSVNGRANIGVRKQCARIFQIAAVRKRAFYSGFAAERSPVKTIQVVRAWKYKELSNFGATAVI
ncbi:MAG: hypothetical protein ACREDR_03315 [Blastocatellia bacterium]